MEEYKTVKEINDKFNTPFCLIDGDEHIEIILNMFNNNVIPESECGSVLCYIAVYYEAIKNDRLKIKYYLKSAESECPNEFVYHKLGKFYKSIGNYDEMEKYLLLGIKNKNFKCSNILQHYYESNNMFVKVLNNCLIDKVKYILDKNLEGEEILNTLTKKELTTYLLNDDNVEHMKNEKIVDFYFDIFETTPIYKHKIYQKLKKFEKTFEIFTCPITLGECYKGYKIKKCGHVFSFDIFRCNKCPLCREECF